MTCKRIFIEDLPEIASESDIQSIFSKYGVVTSIEIKERKNITFRNSSPFFAYINLEIHEDKLQKCFQYFNDNLWHGQHVKLQIAKESFLERLKREREANQEKEIKAKVEERTETVTNKINSERKLKQCINRNGDDEASSNCSNRKLITNKLSEQSKQNESKCTSSSSSSSESEENISKQSRINVNSLEDEIEPLDIVRKNIGNILVNKKLKIEGVGKDPILKVEDIKKKPRSLDKFRSQADHKRIESLLQRRKAYSQQKNAIHTALSYSNIHKSNKIIFDDEGMADNEVTGISKGSNLNKNKSNKKSLFEEGDSDSDEDVNKIFELRQQFQGENGEKLLRLQSTFKNDKRFQLDGKFLENEDNNTEKDDENINLEEEKKKEFEILEEILGHEVKAKNKMDKQYSRNENEIKGMKRFDPSQPDHVKYELKKEDKKPSNRKKKELPINDKKVEDKEEPEVSKDVFYEVKDDLKKTFEEDKGFSLLSTFGITEEKEEVDPGNTPILIEKKKFMPDKNPFQYDSSDDEDQTEQLTQAPSKTLSSIKTWTEPFFFREDDFRLQEGVDFVKRIATEEKEDFTQIRRSLKEIARNKVRSNIRKNRPFKKKLGGSKKKKIRRLNNALKR